MHREPDPYHRPALHGAEAWVPPLALAIIQIALVVSLIVFIFVARPLQGRITLPSWTIPGATTFSGLLAGYMLLRAILNVRTAYRGYRRSKGPPARF